MKMQSELSDHLARSITRAGSRQTYLTIRWLVDRDLVAEAYRAYAYFRWLDDIIDESLSTREHRLAFVGRQKGLMERLLRGEALVGLSPEEEMLSALARGERKRHGGLASYLRNMMGVMEFDAGRRGRLVSGAEIEGYTRLLSKAVMDGLTYFIGHRYRYPDSAPRYSAVAGAHVTHMLRDAVRDAEAGYFNISREVLEAGRISPRDFDSPPYRAWVSERLRLARSLFREGKQYIRRLGNLRARLAGLAYCARFEPVLVAIEGSGSLLRPIGESPELSSARASAVGSRQSQRGSR